jgi:hypothetical protein
MDQGNQAPESELEMIRAGRPGSDGAIILALLSGRFRAVTSDSSRKCVSGTSAAVSPTVGHPLSILSDGDPLLMARAWQDYAYDRLKTKLLITTPAHHQADGLRVK